MVDAEYSNSLTSWLIANAIWTPKQIMTEQYALLNDIENWRKRPIIADPLTNKQWLLQEQQRLIEKGIKTRVKCKGRGKNEVCVLIKAE